MDNASYEYISLLCDCCEINTQLTALVIAKPVCLAIGVTVFVSMYEDYMSSNKVIDSLKLLKTKLLYRLTYIRLKPYINPYTCTVSTILIGGISFNFFKGSELTDVAKGSLREGGV